MKPLEKRLRNLIEQVDAAFLKLDISDKQLQVEQLTRELANSEIWNN